MKRVLMTKAFARWCGLPDEVLCEATREIEGGVFDANLGKGVVKKRVAYPGRGKSGSARVLVAHRMKRFVVFLVGRDKSDPGADFSAAQEEAARQIASGLEKASDAKMEEALKEGTFKEICR